MWPPSGRASASTALTARLRPPHQGLDGCTPLGQVWPPLPLPLRRVPHSPAASSAQPVAGGQPVLPAAPLRAGIVSFTLIISSHPQRLARRLSKHMLHRPRVQCWPRPSRDKPSARPLSMTFPDVSSTDGSVRGRPCCSGSQRGQGPNRDVDVGAAVTSASSHAPCRARFL